MRLEAKKHLFDIKQAADLLEEFTAGKQFAAYQADAMLRAAVEREFEIIGEALAQLARIDEDLAGRVSEHRRIIAFRNILIHGYAHVDDGLAWDIVETRLPTLRREVTALLEEPQGIERSPNEGKIQATITSGRNSLPVTGLAELTAI